MQNLIVKLFGRINVPSFKTIFALNTYNKLNVYDQFEIFNNNIFQDLNRANLHGYYFLLNKKSIWQELKNLF